MSLLNIPNLITPLVFKIGAGIMLALIVLLGVQSARLNLAQKAAKLSAAQVTQLERERDTQTGNVTTANEQHDITKQSVTRLQKALDECNGATTENQEFNAAALAQVQAEAKDSGKALAKIAADYQAAMRDPACLICGNRPICPALLGGAG